MKSNLNIDELLNGFIDGELTQRHRTEVQRMISHDPQIAQRLRELQKCKMLLGSMPRADAPTDMVQRVKESLRENALLTGPAPSFDRTRGTRYLLARKVLAYAAMIGLFAFLGVMVYSIVTPGKSPTTRLVGHQPYAELYGRLELTTNDFTRVNAAIGKEIKRNGLSDYLSQESKADKGFYALSCGPEALGFLLTDLDYIWQRLDSATLFLETDQFGEEIAVGAVDTQQIENIIEQKTLTKRIEVANNLALLNSTTRLLPGQELFVAIKGEGVDMTPIKPIMTRPLEDVRPLLPKSDRKVHLTIVVENRP
ncbi:MAG: anti-sigma factor family protein [Planctomycetota bacterium]|jgi:hypothetical protein